jgi:hypothetical protein
LTALAADLAQAAAMKLLFAVPTDSTYTLDSRVLHHTTHSNNTNNNLKL